MLEKFVFNKVLAKTPNVIRHIYTLFIVLIGWVIFRCESLDSIKTMFTSMFTLKITEFSLNELLIYLETYAIYFILAIIFSMPVYYKIVDKINFLKEGKLKLALNIFHYGSLIVIFIITIMFLAYSSYNPFIYFRF